MFKRYDLAIVNRSFWPKNQIIGEALLQMAELNAQSRRVSVITQASGNLNDELNDAQRGKGILFRACRARSDSATHLVLRIVDAIVFMVWTFWALLLDRPKKVYVSTDPPVLVPFIVFIYAKLFKAKYIYHLQDIHPESANIVIPLNPFLYRILRGIDSMVMRHAESLITLSDAMKQVIIERSNTQSPIYLVDNPALVPETGGDVKRSPGLVFCGNAGRLQRIPLLLESIKTYYEKGGRLPFVFAGGGLYSKDIQALANEYDGVSYLGILPANEAQALNFQYEWALLPIEDDVTKYAFPSKTSSYIVSGTSILSICSKQTSVAKWVEGHKYGINVEPDLEGVVKVFFAIESHSIQPVQFDNQHVKSALSIEFFIQTLSEIILNNQNSRVSNLNLN